MGLLYFRVFTVGNGVRQGSILSPHLFAVYVDDLSVNLIDSGQGCCIDNVFINHMFYADGLCLMAPGPSALHRLINICDKFCIDNDLVFNPGKSICMFIKPPRCKLKCPNLYIGNNQLFFAHTVHSCHCTSMPMTSIYIKRSCDTEFCHL